MALVTFADSYYDSITGSQQSMLPLLTDADAYDAELLLPAPGVLSETAREHDIPVDIVPYPDELDRPGDELVSRSPRSVFTVSAALANYHRAVLKALRDRGTDLLYCNSVKAVLLYGPPARLLGIPVLWYARVDTRFPTVDFVASHVADHVVTISDGTKRRFDPVPFFGAEPETIYTGVDLDRFSAARTRDTDFQIPDRDGPILLEVASIVPRKGQLDLVEAVSRARDELGDFQLVFAGEADDSEYKRGSDYRARIDERIEEAGLEDRVTFLGWCDDVPALLDASDVFVLPSYNEGLPRSILEAFSMGVPVVATPAGGTTELVDDGTNGLIVPPGSPEYLAEAVERLGSDPALRSEMGAAARDTVEASFSIDSYVANFERHVGRMLPLSDRNTAVSPQSEFASW